MTVVCLALVCPVSRLGGSGMGECVSVWEWERRADQPMTARPVAQPIAGLEDGLHTGGEDDIAARRQIFQW